MSRLRSSFPQSGNSCISLYWVVMPFMATLRWSRLSAVTRPVGSGREPADVTRAIAASALSAAAARSGLSCRASPMSSPTVAPGAVVFGAATTGSISANAPTRPTITDRDMALVRGLERNLSSHRLGLALDFGGESQQPSSGCHKARLEAICSRFSAGDCCERRGHRGHAVGRHVDTRSKDDRIRHRFAARLVNEAHRNCYSVTFLDLSFHRLERIVARSCECKAR